MDATALVGPGTGLSRSVALAHELLDRGDGDQLSAVARVHRRRAGPITTTETAEMICDQMTPDELIARLREAAEAPFDDDWCEVFKEAGELIEHLIKQSLAGLQ